MNERTENTYSIVLRDNEANIYIAEVSTYGDYERIEKEAEKLNNEYFEDGYYGEDYYNELAKRTGLNIYQADVLDI